MGVRGLGYYLRGRLNQAASRLANRRAPASVEVPAPLTEVLAGPRTALALSRLLTGRDNAAREAAVARYLERRGVPFSRHRFETFEGRGENFAVDVGEGDRVVVLAGHHDAVPGSPGANDNAAAVAILLVLLERLLSAPPRRLRVRLLFPACEELAYLGARAYVRQVPPHDVVGVLSLELCGIGDTVAVWDAAGDSRFLARVRGALEALGRRPDESYHVVGRIPVFGSDHRAFAAAGVPAYGLTMIPNAEVAALRAFVLNPVRAALGAVTRRPVPFDTYHTSRDTLATLDPAALESVGRVLEAVIAAAAG